MYKNEVGFMHYLTGWLLVCLFMYFPQEYVRVPDKDHSTSRAVCHNSSWKCEQWMCRYTCKMVGGVCAGQCAQVRLIVVKENYHINWPYRTSDWLLSC